MRKNWLLLSWLLLSSIPLTISCTQPDKSDQDKPNLLFIWTDEQQPFTMAAYGNDRIKTPNLNKLAGESIVFQNAYVTQPVCTPSRSSIMTGLYPHSNGCTSNNIALPEDVPCLPEMIINTEFSTAYYGKWHLGDELFAQHGFDEWESIEDIYNQHFSEIRDNQEKSTYHHWLMEKGYTPNVENKFGKSFSRRFAASLPLEHSKPRFLEERSKDFLRRNKDNPFILYINFLEPHMPFTGPLDSLHSPEEVILPESFGHILDENFPERHRKKQKSVKQKYGITEIEMRNLIARYWGLVSQVDMSVGNILKELDDLGLSENTIVVYTSDHGDMMGAHSLVEKGLVFEESARVPLLIRFPAMFKESGLLESRISLIDIVPTILDLMGIAEPDNLQGKSLVPHMQGETLEENYVFTEWNSKSSLNRTVISPEGLKLCVSKEDKDLLFDLENDPNEMINLIDQPEYKDDIIQLTAKILEWQELTGDTVKL